MTNFEDPRIQQYIDNELSDSDRILFEQEIASNPEITEYIQFKKYIIEGIKSEGDEELKEYIRTRVSDESTENQTNLWLYAVASVTLLLVSYFFIIQYFKTGSLKEASKVLVLDQIPIFKPDSKNSAEGVNPLQPNMDTTQLITDSTLALNDVGIATTEEMMVPMNAEPPMEMSASDAPNNDKSALAEGEVFMHKSTLVPIKIHLNSEIKTARKDASAADDDAEIAVIQLSKQPAVSRKKEFDKSEGIKANSSKYFDSTDYKEGRAKNKSIKNLEKSIEKISLTFVQNMKENPSIDIVVDQELIALKINNIDNENPLVYSIQDKLYLELGPKLIYYIPKLTTKIVNPKPITDKLVIKAIQN